MLQPGLPGAAAADACSRNSLKLPRFSQTTLEKLSPLVPHTGSVNNPVDLTFSKNPMDYFAAIPDLLLADSAAGSLLVYYLTPKQLIRRTMESMEIAPDQIPELTEKLFKDQAGSLEFENIRFGWGERHQDGSPGVSMTCVKSSRPELLTRTLISPDKARASTPAINQPSLPR